MIYRIPLTPTNQNIVISLSNQVYNFTLQWNDINNAWMISIYDQNGIGLVEGIAMVLNTNLLESYGYLNLHFTLFALSKTYEAPSFTNLGTIVTLYAQTIG